MPLYHYIIQPLSRYIILLLDQYASTSLRYYTTMPLYHYVLLYVLISQYFHTTMGMSLSFSIQSQVAERFSSALRPWSGPLSRPPEAARPMDKIWPEFAWNLSPLLRRPRNRPLFCPLFCPLFFPLFCLCSVLRSLVSSPLEPM